MKKGEIIKSVSAELPEEELLLINKYTRRPFSREELYTFSVVLCDNDIDRDFERFTVEALFELEKLFVGKTGICDHNPKAENQTARIYSCRVEAVEGKKTQNGDDYFRLVAKAYMPKNEANAPLIDKLESGITKEVSVGLSAKKALCSVCGADRNSAACSHRKGETYGSTLCYFELCDISDAYEWSFVAVPAQRLAGVIKGYELIVRKDKKAMTDIIKALDTRESITLEASASKALFEYIKALEEEAKDGKEYRDSLTEEVLRLSVISQPAISRKTMEKAVKGLSLSELREFISALKEKSAYSSSNKPQLMVKSETSPAKGNKEFKI